MPAKKETTKVTAKPSKPTKAVKLERTAVKSKDPFAGRKYLYAVGRRKSSVAQVRVFSRGKGTVLINGKTLEEFFPYFEHSQTVLQPFEEIGKAGKYDVSAKLVGGGSRGQSEAVRLGISRALVKGDEGVRKSLKARGYLKRDPREKERKKPGLKRARRAPQWKKR